MSFGEHFENAVTVFVDKVDAMIKRHHDWNEESISLGLISDDEKLRMLKAELYREVRLTSPNTTKIQQITDAIQLLEEIKNAEETRHNERLKLKLSFWGQLNEVCNVAIFLSIAILISSYIGYYSCGNNKNLFCNQARLNVYQIQNFFDGKL